MSIIRTAKDEGEFRAKVKYHERRFTTCYNNGLFLDDDMILTDRYAAYAKNENRLVFQFITIGFPYQDNFDYKIADKICSKKWMHRWSYRWEFGKDGTHPHLNIICSKTKPKSQVIRECASTARVQSNYVNVIEGHKRDYEKYYVYAIHKNKDNDDEIRQTLNLKPYTSYDMFLTEDEVEINNENSENEKNILYDIHNNA